MLLQSGAWTSGTGNETRSSQREQSDRHAHRVLHAVVSCRLSCPAVNHEMGMQRCGCHEKEKLELVCVSAEVWSKLPDCTTATHARTRYGEDGWNLFGLMTLTASSRSLLSGLPVLHRRHWIPSCSSSVEESVNGKAITVRPSKRTHSQHGYRRVFLHIPSVCSPHRVRHQAIPTQRAIEGIQSVHLIPAGTVFRGSALECVGECEGDVQSFPSRRSLLFSHSTPALVFFHIHLH